MIQIKVNDECVEIEEAATLSRLLDRLQINRPHIAVAVNEQIIPKSRHGETRLQGGDKVVIVHAVGGG